MSGKKQTFSKPMADTSPEICSQRIDDYDFEDDMRELPLDDIVNESDDRKAAAARKSPAAGTSGTAKRAKTSENNWTAAKHVEAEDPIVRAAMKSRMQWESVNSTRSNPLGNPFVRPLHAATGKDHANNETDSDQFFHSNYSYRSLDLCIRRSRTERYGHYLHFLKLRQVNGDIVFHKRIGIQADAIPALIRCLTELQNEIQAYPKQASINF